MIKDGRILCFCGSCQGLKVCDHLVLLFLLISVLLDGKLYALVDRVKTRFLIKCYVLFYMLQTVSAYHFELHAGSTKKHPSENIYLENGSSIRDVIRACMQAPLDTLELTIRNAIGPVGEKTLSCGKCKGDDYLVTILVLIYCRDI